MTIDPDLGVPGSLEDVLARRTVRDPAARAAILASIHAHAVDEGRWDLSRLDALMRAEEHFQGLLQYDQIDVLRSARALPTADREFARDVQRICLESANGLQRFLRNREAWAEAPPELVFRVTGLALNAIHGYVKWGNIVEEPGRVTPWRQMHALYALAEAGGYAQVPFVLHASRPSFKPSVQTLYLRALLLDLLDIGKLSKLQVEIADGWLCAWSADYTLDAEYSPRRHLFHVDLDSDAGMRPMRREAVGSSVRYLGAEALKAQVEEVQVGLRHGRLYAGHGAGALFPVEEHVALLAVVEKVNQALVAGSDSRIEERTRLEDREVDVALGIERVLRKVHGLRPEAAVETIEISPEGLAKVESGEAAAAAPFDESQSDPDIDRWRVHDVSSHGFGLLVDRAEAEAVLLNGLLALRNHVTGGWLLGSVVRKQLRAAGGEVLLGIEILSYRPIAVTLRDEAGESSPALYLPGEDASGKRDALVVRPAGFQAEARSTITTGETSYAVRMNRVLRKGPDWVSARFELVSRA